MHYATVLDTEQFSERGDRGGRGCCGRRRRQKRTTNWPGRFDLLMDARNHVYSVDFYVVDVTLLADYDSRRITAGETGCRFSDELVGDWRADRTIGEQSTRRHLPSCGARWKRARRALSAGDRTEPARRLGFAGGNPGGPLGWPGNVAAEFGRDRSKYFGQFEFGVLAAVAGDPDQLWIRRRAARRVRRRPVAASAATQDALGTARRAANRRPLGHATRCRRGRKRG